MTFSEDAPPLEVTHSMFPDALSIAEHGREGGFGFLNRVFKRNMETGKPTVMSIGRNYAEYNYQPGHTSFLDGVTILVDHPGDDWRTSLNRVGAEFDLDRAFKEAGLNRTQVDSLLYQGIKPSEKLVQRARMTGAEFIANLRKKRQERRAKL